MVYVGIRSAQSVKICCSGTHFCCSEKRRQTLAYSIYSSAQVYECYAHPPHLPTTPMIFDLSKTAAVNGDAASAASSSSSQRRRRAPSSSRKRPAVHRRLVVVAVVVVAPVALLLSVLSLRSMRRMMTTSDATREYASSLVAELATNLPPGFHAETKLPSSSSSSSSSPACRPHFRLALPGGGWTDKTKFKRLYFYHVRKAGVREREFDCSFPPPSIFRSRSPRDPKRSCRQESAFFLAFSSVRNIKTISTHTHTHARAPLFRHHHRRLLIFDRVRT